MAHVDLSSVSVFETQYDSQVQIGDHNVISIELLMKVKKTMYLCVEVLAVTLSVQLAVGTVLRVVRVAYDG